MTIRYCSPEWLDESAKRYRTTDRFENALKKVTTKIFYRITAEPTWGIDTPQVWKGILRKDKKFISEFMLGKVKLESGSKPGLLKITPYANHFVDALTQFPLQFPDEMSAEELDTYRADLSGFRETSGV